MNYEFLDDMDLDNISLGNMPDNFAMPKDSNINSNGYNGFDVLGGSTNPNYQNGKNDLNLFNPYEGYLKGNAFKDEYRPYKDYKVAKLNINNEKDDLLIGIGQYSFMMHDMNLYLDVHPNDREALNKFIMYRDKVNELINNYERKYGPLCVKGDMNNNIPFAWENSMWPWGK